MALMLNFAQREKLKIGALFTKVDLILYSELHFSDTSFPPSTSLSKTKDLNCTKADNKQCLLLLAAYNSPYCGQDIVKY